MNFEIQKPAPRMMAERSKLGLASLLLGAAIFAGPQIAAAQTTDTVAEATEATGAATADNDMAATTAETATTTADEAAADMTTPATDAAAAADEAAAATDAAADATAANATADTGTDASGDMAKTDDMTAATATEATSETEPMADMRSLSAEIAGTDGASHGTVTLSDTASGAVEVKLDLSGLPQGEHAVHIHETGECTAPDFKSSGGHLTGDKEHGAHSEGGMHSGDLPNVQVGEDGAAKATFFTQNVTLDQVMDEDGSAFVVHEGADDYMSQPSGDAGARIACGVFGEAQK